MTPDNIRRLLALASGFTPLNSPRTRQERDARVQAWQLAFTATHITDAHYDQAQQAVIDYYTNNRDAIMPADIISRIKTTTSPAPGILTQRADPCDVCGLQPGNRRHSPNGHPYAGHLPPPRTSDEQPDNTPPAIDWHQQMQHIKGTP